MTAAEELAKVARDIYRTRLVLVALMLYISWKTGAIEALAARTHLLEGTNAELEEELARAKASTDGALERLHELREPGSDPDASTGSQGSGPGSSVDTPG